MKTIKTFVSLTQVESLARESQRMLVGGAEPVKKEEKKKKLEDPYYIHGDDVPL